MNKIPGWMPENLYKSGEGFYISKIATQRCWEAFKKRCYAGELAFIIKKEALDRNIHIPTTDAIGMAQALTIHMTWDEK